MNKEKLQRLSESALEQISGGIPECLKHPVTTLDGGLQFLPEKIGNAIGGKDDSKNRYEIGKEFQKGTYLLEVSAITLLCYVGIPKIVEYFSKPSRKK